MNSSNLYAYKDLPEVVQEMGRRNISGNVIPMEWYQTLCLSSGKPDLVSITILADIVYWHRPVTVRDEQTGQVIGYRKKFKDEYFRRSYKAFETLYGFSNKQVREALIRLEEDNIVKRIFKNLNTPDGTLPNIMFLKLNPVALEGLSNQVQAKPYSENLPENIQSSDLERSSHVSLKGNMQGQSQMRQGTSNTCQTGVAKKDPSLEGKSMFPSREGSVSLEGKHKEINNIYNKTLSPRSPLSRFGEREQKLIEIWNQILVEDPIHSVRLTAERGYRLAKAMREHFGDDENRFKEYCELMKTSDFLMGKVTKFKVDIKWALRDENIIRVLEGSFQVDKKKIPGAAEKVPSPVDIKIQALSPEEKVLHQKLIERITRQTYSPWFRDVDFKIQGKTIEVKTKSRFSADYMTGRFNMELRSVFENAGYDPYFNVTIEEEI